MPKKMSFEYAAQNPDKVERRLYTVHSDAVEPPSSRVIWFDCPFCMEEVKAYVWSLSGGGKRCQCGALFGRSAGLHFCPAKKSSEG
jgi:hypothetical protein